MKTSTRLAIFVCFLVLYSCAVPDVKVRSQNPFPLTQATDPSLVSDFQKLATDSRFLSYQLFQVQQGKLNRDQIYDIEFQGLSGTKFILVSACGVNCTLPDLIVYDQDKKRALNTLYRSDRVYVSQDVGTRNTLFRAEISLKNCQQQFCDAYWALYVQ